MTFSNELSTTSIYVTSRVSRTNASKRVSVGHLLNRIALFLFRRTLTHISRRFTFDIVVGKKEKKKNKKTNDPTSDPFRSNVTFSTRTEEGEIIPTHRLRFPPRVWRIFLIVDLQKYKKINIKYALPFIFRSVYLVHLSSRVVSISISIFGREIPMYRQNRRMRMEALLIVFRGIIIDHKGSARFSYFFFFFLRCRAPRRADS